MSFALKFIFFLFSNVKFLHDGSCATLRSRTAEDPLQKPCGCIKYPLHLWRFFSISDLPRDYRKYFTCWLFLKSTGQINEELQVTSSQTGWLLTVSQWLHNVQSQILDFAGEGSRGEACAVVHISSARHGDCSVQGVDAAGQDWVSSGREAGTHNEVHMDETPQRTSVL